MKGSHKYVLFITVFVLVCFALGQRMPRRFVWEASFSHNDRQPFGCHVFDSIMTESMPRGYAVLRKTFTQINNDKKMRNSNLLVLCDLMSLNAIDLRSMDSLLRRGSHVMIAVLQSADARTDSTIAYNYGLSYNGSIYFNVDNIKNFLRGMNAYESYDTLFWRNPDTTYPPMQASSFNSISGGSVIVDRRMCETVKFDTLLWKYSETIVPEEQNQYFRYYVARKKEMRKKNKLKEYNDSAEWLGQVLNENITQKTPVAVTRSIGNGKLTVVAMPLAFTNYGVLDRQLLPVVMRLMTQIADCPVIRTTAYTKTTSDYEAELSPMRYVLNKKPLRHAWYLTVFALVLFCVFKARRRQRIIPVVSPPKNHTLEFAKLIGTLYYHRGDNADLLRKKFTFFAERLRTTLQVDILEHKLPPDAARLIARRTSLKEEQVKEDLLRLRLDYFTEGTIDEREMKWAINRMDEILKQI